MATLPQIKAELIDEMINDVRAMWLNVKAKIEHHLINASERKNEMTYTICPPRVRLELYRCLEITHYGLTMHKLINEISEDGCWNSWSTMTKLFQKKFGITRILVKSKGEGIVAIIAEL